jgi:hypothetical protein
LFRRVASPPLPNMVLGILTSIAACPAIIGTVEAVRQGQRQSAKERHRGAKTNLVVSSSNIEIDGCPVELRDGRVRHPLTPWCMFGICPHDEFKDPEPSNLKADCPPSFTSPHVQTKAVARVPRAIPSPGTFYPTRSRPGVAEAKDSSPPSATTRRS